MVSSFFYNLIIVPIVNILEFFYVFFEAVAPKGVAVIALSFIVTLCCLPLYIVAERWQENERNIQKKLKPGIDRIKSAFKGDEQYMILTEFYRQNHYNPLYALRSSFSLLIQIPFFIAAYSFLSNLESLKGYSFLFIKDFGSQDHLFKIGSFYINILPILMTLINVVSGIIYSKGHALSEKIQIFVSAGLFLILLYNSPAGLVLYWTMNNILSLVKNVFFKLKNPGKVFHIVCTIILGFGVIWSFTTGKKIYIFGMIILFCLVLFYFKISKFLLSVLDKNFTVLDIDKKLRNSVFFISSFSLALLSGLVIPSFIIESSPANFCYIDDYKSPFIFLKTSFVQSLGLYFFWPFCLYKLFSDKVKKIFSLIFPIFFICGIVNCFGFSGNYGALNDDLTFMHEVVFPSFSENLMSLISIILVISLIFILVSKKVKIFQSVLLILMISCFAISAKNIFVIDKNFKNMDITQINKIEPIFHLSKTNKNVLVIMQDACESPFVTQSFKDYPELAEKFNGFTFYPNSVSFSHYTQVGIPGLLGGYDYTPYEINQRPEKTIQQKHNEAILTMPTLFSAEGFNISMNDVPYENYGEEPVKKIYENIPNIERHTTKRVYNKYWYEKNGIKPYPVLSNLIKRNFQYLSLFKIVPPCFRAIVFHRQYWRTESTKINDKFFDDSYSTLDLMTELTDFNSEKPNFIYIGNETTHESRLLNPEDYTPFYTDENGNKKYLSLEELKNKNIIGNKEFSTSNEYNTVNAILRKWAEFFDYLKDNECYDNTRIIIVSDHGRGDNSKQFNHSDDINFSKETVLATLLVKDFNSNQNLKFNYTFMTNADTPYLAAEGIVSELKNPFTNSELKLSQNQKNELIKIAVAPMENMRSMNNTKFNIKDNEWFTVKDNIFDENNWKRFNKK